MTLDTFLKNRPDLVVFIKDEKSNIICSSTDIDFMNQLIPITLSEYYHPLRKKYYKVFKSYVSENNHTFQIIRYNDITNLKQLKQSYEIDETTQIHIKKKALTDFNQYIREAIKKYEEFSVVMADIDFFKNVNDTHGHQAGDYVLHEVAQILYNNIRHNDNDFNDIIGRFGGEEFLLILKDVPASVSFKRLEIIRSKIQDNSVLYGATNIHVTCSFGAVHISSTYLKEIAKNKIEISSLEEEIIKKADQLLYQAKNGGRNKVFIKRLTT